jgi:hypothetical protein
MCTDFTYLNTYCLKDDFLLARIDLVDSATTSEMMALLDCFFGYHQIWHRPEDEEKTSLSLHSEPIATSECRRGSAMQDPLSVE